MEICYNKCKEKDAKWQKSLHKERRMYRKDSGQISIAEYLSPFGKLDENNRWVKKAALIPWERIEERYAALFESNTGNVAKPVRMALGALLVKQELEASDDETVETVLENVYIQYFIGLHEFTTTAPFSATTMVYFRKRLTAEILAEINEMMFAPEKPELDDNDDDNNTAGGDRGNSGMLIPDATCTPADITYPTDVGLLNDAREKLEQIIDLLHSETRNAIKPRTYREIARWDFLRFIKRGKKSKKQVRGAIRKQLGYVRRDLGYIDSMLERTDTSLLPARLRQYLATIRTLYQQQETMYRTKTHRTEDRIVSISQPHVRPIVRGKTNAAVEFGAKISISLVNGYSFIDKIGWNNYSEAELLPQALEAYRERFGHYPEAVLADKLYRNRDNLRYCKERGVRLSGPRLGRPPKDGVPDPYERPDSAARNAVEGKFGEGKAGYGLGRIMARLQGTAETVIAIAFLSMNLNRKLRVLWLRFFVRFELGCLQLLPAC